MILVWEYALNIQVKQGQGPENIVPEVIYKLVEHKIEMTFEWDDPDEVHLLTGEVMILVWNG